MPIIPVGDPSLPEPCRVNDILNATVEHQKIVLRKFGKCSTGLRRRQPPVNSAGKNALDMGTMQGWSIMQDTNGAAALSENSLTKCPT